MLALLLKQAGIDPDMLTAQAQGLTESFRHIGVRLEGIEARAEAQADVLYRIEQNLVALMTHHGLYVEPSPDVVELIEARSADAVREAENPVRVSGGLS